MQYITFAALIAVASAGVVPYEYHHAGPAVSYSSSVSHVAPVHGHSALIAAPAYHSAPAIHAAQVVHNVATPTIHTVAAPVVAKYAAPILTKTIVAEHPAPASYDFEYSVHDPHTGDAKSQHESRRGDAVQGSYSLLDADGSKRVVHYTADAHNGFNAVVEKQPGVHPVVTKAVTYAEAPALTYAHVGHHY